MENNQENNKTSAALQLLQTNSESEKKKNMTSIIEDNRFSAGKQELRTAKEKGMMVKKYKPESATIKTLITRLKDSNDIQQFQTLEFNDFKDKYGGTDDYNKLVKFLFFNDLDSDLLCPVTTTRIQKKTFFFPTTNCTLTLFNTFETDQVEEAITGLKGIGKTYSILLYCLLHQMGETCRCIPIINMDDFLRSPHLAIVKILGYVFAEEENGELANLVSNCDTSGFEKMLSNFLKPLADRYRIILMIDQGNRLVDFFLEHNSKDTTDEFKQNLDKALQIIKLLKLRARKTIHISSASEKNSKYSKMGITDSQFLSKTINALPIEAEVLAYAKKLFHKIYPEKAKRSDFVLGLIKAYIGSSYLYVDKAIRNIDCNCTDTDTEIESNIRIQAEKYQKELQWDFTDYIEKEDDKVLAKQRLWNIYSALMQENSESTTIITENADSRYISVINGKASIYCKKLSLPALTRVLNFRDVNEYKNYIMYYGNLDNPNKSVQGKQIEELFGIELESKIKDVSAKNNNLSADFQLCDYDSDGTKLTLLTSSVRHYTTVVNFNGITKPEPGTAYCTRKPNETAYDYIIYGADGKLLFIDVTINQNISDCKYSKTGIAKKCETAANLCKKFPEHKEVYKIILVPNMPKIATKEDAKAKEIKIAIIDGRWENTKGVIDKLQIKI
jgi:hypothetical protein